ncbi:hypothetical protein AMELA_G00248410 [Ameiurus melas]|uniref:Uncharacterized protein n=1 Tax=Ameiurus melas TaxID=219545 RepID=A0A7J5ZTM8_AMEME|nr:hypothetical protein AMELA_G00248410 [Ameiurus melas]
MSCEQLHTPRAREQGCSDGAWILSGHGHLHEPWSLGSLEPIPGSIGHKMGPPLCPLCPPLDTVADTEEGTRLQ